MELFSIHVHKINNNADIGSGELIVREPTGPRGAARARH